MILTYKLTPLSRAKIIGHAWLAFKGQSSMKSPCGILWKGVLEPLTHLCTDLKISEESKGEG